MNKPSNNPTPPQQETFDFDQILKFARQISAEVESLTQISIPVTSNAKVQPSLIPYDFQKQQALIETRGVKGLPTILFDQKRGITIHANLDGKLTILHRQSGEIQGLDLSEARQHFTQAITKCLKQGYKETNAPLDPPESKRKPQL